MTKTSVKILNLFVVVAMLFSAAVVSAKPAQAAADVSAYAYSVKILWPHTLLVDQPYQWPHLPAVATYAKPYGAYFKAGATIQAEFVVGDPDATFALVDPLDWFSMQASSCVPATGYIRYWIGSTRAVEIGKDIFPGARPVANVCAPTVAERTFTMPAKDDGYYYFRVDVTTDPDPLHWNDISWGKDIAKNALVSDNTKPTGTLIAPAAGETLVANRQYQIKWTGADLPVNGKIIKMRAEYLLTTTGKKPYDGLHGSQWYTVCTVPLIDVPLDPTDTIYSSHVTTKVCPTGMEVTENNPLWWVDPMLMSPNALLRITLTDVAGNSFTITSGAFQIIGLDNTTPITGLYIPSPVDLTNDARGVWPVIGYALDPDSGVLNVRFQYAFQEAPDNWIDMIGDYYQFNPYLPLASKVAEAEYNQLTGGEPFPPGNNWFFLGWDTTPFAGRIVRVKITAMNGVGAVNINDSYSDPRCPFGVCFPVSQWVKILPAPIKVEITRPINKGTVTVNSCGQVSPTNAAFSGAEYGAFRYLVTVRASAIDDAAGIFRVEFRGAPGTNDWMPMYSSTATTGIPDTYSAYLNTTGWADGDTGTLEVRVWTGTNEWYPAYADFTVEEGQGYFGCSFEKELNPGWNLVSLPLAPDNSAIANILKTATTASYVKSVDTWTWKTTLTPERYAPPVNSLTQMVDGKGYWINVSDLTAISYAGSFANDPSTQMLSYPIYKGWNLIGFTPWTDPTIAGGATVNAQNPFATMWSITLHFNPVTGSPWFKNQTVAQYLRPALTEDFNGVQGMYMWDVVNHIYRWVNLDDTMEAGQGYWLASAKEGTIFP